MRLQLAVLLAACLAFTVSAELKHPFFSEGQLAAAKGYGDYKDSSLFLQAKAACFQNNQTKPDEEGIDFTIAVGCYKDPRDYNHDSLDVTTDIADAGWCIYHHNLENSIVPIDGTYLMTFQAQCYLSSTSHECKLDDCQNTVAIIEGTLVRQEDTVFDVEPTTVAPKPGFCKPAGTTEDDDRHGTAATWSAAMAKRFNVPSSGKWDSHNNNSTADGKDLWEGPAYIYRGFTNFYNVHGHHLGSGKFQSIAPDTYTGDFDPISHEECGDRKIYTPYTIKTGISKPGYYRR